jgi:nucleotide-binding universal stress UspA family protein
MFTRILVAIDGSETSQHAFDAALKLAHDNSAELQTLYVVDIPANTYSAPGIDPSGLDDAMREEGNTVIAAARAQMTHNDIKGEARFVDDFPLGQGIAHSILNAATDMNADLVVMGTHGRRGFQRLLLGSVAERFVRMACCPVLLIPAHHEHQKLETPQAATAQQLATEELSPG